MLVAPAPAAESAVYVMGDVHGQLARLTQLLQDAGLIDPDGLWTERPLWRGGTATLWFLGDFFDRGPAGLGVVDLVMRLQREAAAAGGTVGALLGNHEILILAAQRCGPARSGGGGTFLECWQVNGGEPADLDGLTARYTAWISRLPAMALVADRLLIHADSPIYARLGGSVAAVNAAVAGTLAGTDPVAYDRLLAAFAGRNLFSKGDGVGIQQAAAYLAQFGGRQIIHGHTPISDGTGQEPTDVTTPRLYADGLCVNVDGGLYQGGPGFLYRLPSLG
ncbi:MAG: metallophosphoesterase [Chloroflexota bacterium]|nr:metallophosphoesterase [Chloroflexota bacterium]